MLLYHGTTLKITYPKIITSEIGRDFGFAFYTTDIKPQAERWARRRALILQRQTKQNQPAIVNIYRWHQHDGLHIKELNGASRDWLDLVVTCRSRPDYHHDYDIVIGKIADDNVGEIISYVIAGIMRPEDAIKRLQFEHINNQIAFCTPASLKQLEFVTSYQVKD